MSSIGIHRKVCSVCLEQYFEISFGEHLIHMTDCDHALTLHKFSIPLKILLLLTSRFLFKDACALHTCVVQLLQYLVVMK